MRPNPTQRFTGRVKSYRRYRPGYPVEMVNLLRRECGLSDAALVADVAAGTGLLTEVLLASGLPVVAVEPNDEMRAACAELEPKFPKLRCVAGTAEATDLPAASVDLITVAQAMHWFDLEKTKAEFTRILKPGGGCAVIYNNRRMGGDAFHDGYEGLLRDFGVDYLKVQSQHVHEESLREFFAPQKMHRATFPNRQSFDLKGLEGRILSSSYMPQPGHPRFTEMDSTIELLFAKNERSGLVTMEYECVVSWGRVR